MPALTYTVLSSIIGGNRIAVIMSIGGIRSAVFQPNGVVNGMRKLLPTAEAGASDAITPKRNMTLMRLAFPR